MKREILWRFGAVTVFAGAFAWDYGYVNLSVFLVLLGFLEVAYPHIAGRSESTIESEVMREVSGACTRCGESVSFRLPKDLEAQGILCGPCTEKFDEITESD